MAKLRFHKEFHDELLRLDVYIRFCKNIRKERKYINADFLAVLDNSENFTNFIRNGFNWHNSNEGWDFWETVSQGRHVYKYKDAEKGRL